MLVCPSAPALAWTPSPRDLTPRHRELPSPTLATSAMPATMVTISARDLLTLVLMLTTATPTPTPPLFPSAPAPVLTPSPRALPFHTLATSAMPVILATMVTTSARDLLMPTPMPTTATPMPMLVWDTMVMLVWATMLVMPDTPTLPSTPPMFPSAPAPVWTPSLRVSIPSPRVSSTK